MSPTFLRWARKHWNIIAAHMEYRQRQERFRVMLMVNPQLRAAHEALSRDRKRHAPTRADIQAMREALHNELRREVGC